MGEPGGPKARSFLENVLALPDCKSVPAPLARLGLNPAGKRMSILRTDGPQAQARVARNLRMHFLGGWFNQFCEGAPMALFRTRATPSQLPSGFRPFFPDFWEGLPFKVNQPKKNALFPRGHWASEPLTQRLPFGFQVFSDARDSHLY